MSPVHYLFLVYTTGYELETAMFLLEYLLYSVCKLNTVVSKPLASNKRNE